MNSANVRTVSSEGLLRLYTTWLTKIAATQMISHTICCHENIFWASLPSYLNHYLNHYLNYYLNHYLNQTQVNFLLSFASKAAARYAAAYTPAIHARMNVTDECSKSRNEYGACSAVSFPPSMSAAITIPYIVIKTVPYSGSYHFSRPTWECCVETLCGSRCQGNNSLCFHSKLQLYLKPGSQVYRRNSYKIKKKRKQLYFEETIFKLNHYFIGPSFLNLFKVET